MLFTPHNNPTSERRYTPPLGFRRRAIYRPHKATLAAQRWRIATHDAPDPASQFRRQTVAHRDSYGDAGVARLVPVPGESALTR
jgi:hypothetical protein